MKDKIRGELPILISTLFFAVVAILVKTASKSLTGPFISLFRFITGITLGIIILLITRNKFKIYDKKLLLLRGIFGATAMILYYTGIQMTGSGRATLLTYTYPIFVALFGYLFFKEKITKRTITSLALCIVGIFFVFYDGSSYTLTGTAIGLISAMASAMAVIYIKKSRERNNPVVVYLAACFIGLIFSSFSIKEITTLTQPVLLTLILLGTIVFIGQMFLGYGYKRVSATRGSTISLLVVPLTIFLSYFLGEEMRIRFFIGAGLIIMGLLINRK